jgi:hypothetical protein
MDTASAAVAKQRAKELARLDNLERTYWEAYERSCQRSETASEKQQRDGNPRFLEGIQRCVALRCQILGLIDKKETARLFEPKLSAMAVH